MMFTKLVVGSLGLLTVTLAVLPVNANKLPRNGTVLKMTNGDIMCYVELRDVSGKKHTIGADFELCNKPKKFLNRRVQITYARVKVNDCESAEPCGKTRWETLAVRLKLPQ
jgi:hypothetical protein